MISFSVPGEPQPWSVYTKRGKEPLGHQKMRSYQMAIQAHANDAMDGSEHGAGPTIEGPVEIALVFYVTPQSQRKGRDKEGDLTNYQKAAEDALQNIVMTNDIQTMRMVSEKRYDGESHTEITVTERRE